MKVIFRRPVLSACLRSKARHVRFISSEPESSNRGLELASRQYLKNFWIPQASVSQRKEDDPDVGQLLIRAGYLRQAYSGIFHMLPLGLRVQNKLEALIDKHMQSVRASKVSLSSISSQKLWKKSGRLEKGTEFLKFKDRKGADWLLAPTHEEEITGMVRDTVHSRNHLPIRLYQITRKYRDEKRPRGGLLRGREFLMKDLYTFDKSEAEAHATYADVRKAYSNLFDELKIPYIEARADSGNMGGSLSHEFHFPSSLGEDDLITCSSCDFAKNEEFVPELKTTSFEVSDNVDVESTPSEQKTLEMVSQSFLSKHRKALVKAFASPENRAGTSSLNPFAVKKCMDGEVAIDTGIEDIEASFEASIKTEEAAKLRVYYLFDQFASPQAIQRQVRRDSEWLKTHQLRAFVVKIQDDQTPQSHLLRKQTGDDCPECASSERDGKLQVTKAIEVGHTFHLGDRYSSKLDFMVPTSNKQEPRVPVSMGCHGIGVSRLIAAAASAMSDTTGLIWPRAIAPFEVLIILPSKHTHETEATDVANQLYDDLAGVADTLIDDRDDANFGWKIKDADLIGYPIVIVIGKSWFERKAVEIQCRRLKLKEEVAIGAAPARIRELLSTL